LIYNKLYRSDGSGRFPNINYYAFEKDSIGLALVPLERGAAASLEMIEYILDIGAAAPSDAVNYPIYI
jgi:hypothetical protein